MIPARVRSLFLAAILIAGVQSATAVELVRGEPSALRIYHGPDAAPSTAHAARELQHFLREMTGVELPIDSDSHIPLPGALCIADRAVPRSWPDPAALGEEGYILRAGTGSFQILGGMPRGVLYGVYGLLQDHFDCRWFTPEVSRIPRVDRLRFPRLGETVVPMLAYREPFVMEMLDPDWAARNRVNGQFMNLDADRGGKITYEGFVHTFESLVPPEQYFDAHPEYFSLVDGERLRHRSQLCATNPDVARVVTEELRRRLRENPEAGVVSVSQNDWHNYCQCGPCTTLADAEGTQAAPILFLVNAVARNLRDEFPDVLVDTLAYQYSRKPPRTMRPESNVIVRLCSIECCFNHPFNTCASLRNKEFVADLKGWAKVCDRVWVWDYVTSFSHYLMPFPNLHVRGPNIRFLADHNVRGVFAQDVYNTLDGELSALSGYLNAQLLWNPRANPREIIEEFVTGVYGPSAPAVRQYLAALEKLAGDAGVHSEIWDGPDAPYMTDAFLARADGLWNSAEDLVRGDGALLQRVRTDRMAVDYAMLERARFLGLGALEKDPGAPWGLRMPEALAGRIARFFEAAEASDLIQIREHGDTVAEYRAGWERWIAAPESPARPAVTPPPLKPGLRYEFFEGRWIALPDFGALTPVESGVAATVNLEVSPADISYALRFTGYFEAPATGLYCFTLVSNDGSRLWIGDERIIDHDVRHMAVPRGNPVALDAGFHPITIEYFQSAGRKHLEFFVEGPGLPRLRPGAGRLWTPAAGE